MQFPFKTIFASAAVLAAAFSPTSLAEDEKDANKPMLTGLAAEAAAGVEARAKLVQEIVDQLFSYSELGFQEFETQKYMTNLLEGEGFTVEQGVSGLPSGWWATWGSGKPVIALGSDVDGIPKSSQMPGVAYRQPMVEGAPGHGEGHNSGHGLTVAAALAVKEIMERENLPGTIMIWPGIAEELVAAKAYYARDGRFKDVDAVLFTHVANNLATSWGGDRGTGLVSVEYSFEGTAAHGAADPWRGKSALDAVELMNIGWNFKREHLHPLQRSHYVIVDGGDQPNVVPSQASVWYFIREMTAKNIRENFDALQQIAEGAAMMTGTRVKRRIIGSAWPRHFNKPMAERMYQNIQAVGLPAWSDDDQNFAKAVQRLMGRSEEDAVGLEMELAELYGPPAEPQSGGSDDIGDVSWNVPTITLRYPSNIGGVIFHHWSSSIAMATPIAHKGAVSGGKALAATMMDLFTQPELLKEAWAYFEEDQLRDTEYVPFIGTEDKPAIEKNAAIMAEFKDRLSQYYYDPEKYDTYLEQLGIEYPQLDKPEGEE